jgi:pyrimidine operon attenuation protein / uracil phosphoribosyltransferase
MTAEKELILDKAQIKQKVKRIAYEILENNIEEKELVIAGIAEGGYNLARILADELSRESDFKIKLAKISLDKKAPFKTNIEVDCDVKLLKDKVIIIVDDVLHTGRTFLQGMKPFLEVDVKKIQTVVLVNRDHTLFPVRANYTGYELSTTLTDHVLVDLTSREFGVYLY